MAMTAAVRARRYESTGEGGGGRPTYQSQTEAAHQSAYQESLKHPHKAKGPGGGQFVKKGQGGGGSGTGHQHQHTPAPKPSAPAPPPERHGGMKTGDSGSDVAELNHLLKQLGLGAGESSTYLPSTDQAVREAQRRLGLHESGKASTALVHKLQAAVALSPCVKRSNSTGGAVDVLTRAAMSTQDINALPDSAFAYIEPGGTKDPSGKTIPRSLRHFPINDPAHVRNALARIAQGAQFGKQALPAVQKAAAKMHIGDYDNEEHEPMGAEEPERMGRAMCCPDAHDGEAHIFRREFAVEGLDIIRSGQGGDGRTVEAYATVFGSPAEIKDQHGHYMEVIDRSAFDDVLRSGFQGVKVFYNHGMHLNGQPSERWSVPIGVPLDVRPDGRGLRTITRFNEGEAGDQVLEAIRNQAITGYSFRGPIRQSNPPRIPRARDGQPLPMVTRTKLGLTEYGPTPMPYYADASILAFRSTIARFMNAGIDPLDAIRMLSSATPLDQAEEDEEYDEDTATPDLGPGAEDQPFEALRSASIESVRRKASVARIQTERVGIKS